MANPNTLPGRAGVPTTHWRNNAKPPFSRASVASAEMGGGGGASRRAQYSLYYDTPKYDTPIIPYQRIKLSPK